MMHDSDIMSDAQPAFDWDQYWWRDNMIARWLNLALSALVFQLFVYFILRTHIWTMRWAAFNISMISFTSLTAECLLPLIYGTTPGEAIIGLRIKNLDGSNLTRRQIFKWGWLTKKRKLKMAELGGFYHVRQRKSPGWAVVFWLIFLGSIALAIAIPFAFI